MKPEEYYTVSEFMNKDLVEVTPGTTAKQCAEVMAAERVSSAIITENNAIVGIITEKDFARKVVAKGLDSNKILVKDIMTTDVITVEPNTSLYDAMLKLNGKKIKHLPVVSDNVVVGIITAMDILRVQPSYMELLAAQSGSGNI
ncbi:CBS domain-containing protein [Candidatus Woesearchaeota archaeon]|nr:CBS domain-containing protein [Candidatus Woesearchaeota archaeon]